MSAWELAEELEGFLVMWLNETLYEQRLQLSGREMGNGFEMWRLFFYKYRGGDAAIVMAGITRLQEVGRCDKIDSLDDHLNAWEGLLAEHGKELLNCPHVEDDGLGIDPD